MNMLFWYLFITCFKNREFIFYKTMVPVKKNAFITINKRYINKKNYPYKKKPKQLYFQIW